MSNYEIFHRLLNQFHAHRLTSFQFRLISSTFLEKYKHIEQASKRLFCFYFLYFTDCGFELSFLLFASLFDMIIWIALIMMPLNASWDADLCRKFERVSLCQRTTGNVNQSLLIKENRFNKQIRENFTNYPSVCCHWDKTFLSMPHSILYIVWFIAIIDWRRDDILIGFYYDHDFGLIILHY